MIDMHVHLVPPRLPGVGSLNPLLEADPESIAAALRAEMQAAGTTEALAMGSLAITPEDPLGIHDTLAIAGKLSGVFAIGATDPGRTDLEHFRQVESVLASGQVRALKAYLGYLPYGPDHPSYRPYYELAAQYRIPVIFHTGDTYSPRAKLRYARPLLVDEVAVDHPNVRFVLAHFGNPWLTDAAEVVYKNINVWADLSGLVIGDHASFTEEERRDVLHDTATAVSRAFRYADRPNRFLYGSDWPLAPMTAYRDFIRGILPSAHHQAVFEDNSRVLFRLD
ncbi:MAG TPA: amidohydrolase family protein [Gemmataceae bacterium]|nr:amidohydrolase family protein [Gemmataceae bacterium]